MGSLVDALAAEDRVSVKFSDFYTLMKGVSDKQSDVDLTFGERRL